MDPISKGEIPFVRTLMPLFTGICAGYWFQSTAAFVVVTYFSAALLCVFGVLVFCYKKIYSYRYRWVFGLTFNLLIALAGYVCTCAGSQLLSPNHFSKVRTELLLICVRSEPKLASGILRFEAQVKKGIKQDRNIDLSGKLLIAVKADPKTSYRYGDLLLVPSIYTDIEGPKNPGEFDYRHYLANHQIYQQTYVDARRVRLIQRDQGNSIISFSLNLRQHLVEKFAFYISDKDAASVASTLILGYRADLSKEVLDAYSKTGTVHVLSVSGMHVGIVYIVMVFLLQFMERSRKMRLMRAVLMIALVWFYAVLTGFSPSVCRSAMMISFVIIGKAIQKNQNTYNLLAISAVLLLIYDPYFLLDVGFQLSYLSVIGLVFFYPRIYNMFYIKNWAVDKIWSYIALSTAAQLATFPLSMYYFHQFPVYFLLSNIFIILPVAFIMYAGLLFLFVPWDVVLKPLGWILNRSIGFTNRGLLYIENIPFANIEGIWISIFTYLFIYAFILTAIYGVVLEYKRLIYCSLCIAMLLAMNTFIDKIAGSAQRQVVFYSLRKNTGIGFFEGSNGILMTDLDREEKAFTYSIKPSIGLLGIQNLEMINPNRDLLTDNFFTDGNFVQFRNWKLLVWNKEFNKKQFPKRISVDAVLIRDNPQIEIDSIKNAINFKILLIDGTNSDYRIHQWRAQARDNKIEYYVIKGSPAYSINL